MPTREENVVQIEAVLRQRFFPHVPKVETTSRVGWTEEQHDTDRLSRSLAAYVLVNHCDIDDLTAVGAITDGSNDGGIDALYFDRRARRLVFVQSKFKRTGTAPSQDEVLKTITGVKTLHARRFNEFNEAFQTQLADIEEALDTPGIKINLLFAFFDDTVRQQATNTLNGFCTEWNHGDEVITWQVAGTSWLYHGLVAAQKIKTVDDEIALENWVNVRLPYKVYYGQLQAAELARLVQKHGSALFERNIRHYLGSAGGVNSAIEQTVSAHPGNLFYLNNGITAVAKTITQAAGQPRRTVLGLQSFSIVNGAQTTGAIANAAERGMISADAKVLITIIEIGDGGDALGREITNAHNYQNVVRGVDFAALDPNQEKLRRELASIGITYFYRPSQEARVRRDDAFTLEEAAVAMACLGFYVRASGRVQADNVINLVVTAKAEIGRLWERDGELYQKLFPDNLAGVRLCRLVQIYRFIDEILAASERSEPSYQRRMFFRHGRYFIMAFVAHRSQPIIKRLKFYLSEDDRRELSHTINELAELIYAVSEPRQNLKGYLSTFRNLTDAQQLADEVLRRLAQLDAPLDRP